MLLVYPKFYFLPVTKEVKYYEAEIYRENAKEETAFSKAERYNKLLAEIDDEFVKEELVHIS